MPPTDIDHDPTPSVRPLHPERRRRGWGEFRNAYPGILAVLAVALVVLLAADAWLLYERTRYDSEITRLRSGMTDVEKRRTDMVVESEENRLQVMVELARRQALGDKTLHLSVAVDSGRMHLEREGAQLRDMRIAAGPARLVGESPDTIRIVPPRGTRKVARLLSASDAWEVPTWVYLDRGVATPAERTLKGALGPTAIVLDGGTVIYSMPTVGPLNDSSYVLPGSIRARAADLKAILPNLQVGMTVYFY